MSTGKLYVLSWLQQRLREFKFHDWERIFSLSGCEQGMLLAKYSAYKCYCKPGRGYMREKKKTTWEFDNTELITLCLRLLYLQWKLCSSENAFLIVRVGDPVTCSRKDIDTLRFGGRLLKYPILHLLVTEYFKGHVVCDSPSTETTS